MEFMLTPEAKDILRCYISVIACPGKKHSTQENFLILDFNLIGKQSSKIISNDMVYIIDHFYFDYYCNSVLIFNNNFNKCVTDGQIITMCHTDRF